ncbi:MAG: O-antigen ligase family protein [Alphaproteobacteria bacterium]|nr:O-antigen ligase family protein [Alphaproteobacteria bacterium]
MNNPPDMDEVSRVRAFPRGVITAVLVPLLVSVIFVPRFLGFAPAIIGVAGYIWVRFSTGRWPAFPCALLGWMAGIIGLGLLSALWALDPGLSAERALDVAPVLLGGALFTGFALQTAKDDLSRFQRIFPLAVLVMGVLCVVELYAGAPLYKLLRPGLTRAVNMSGLNRSVIVYTLCSIIALDLAWRTKNFRILAGLAAVFAAILFKTQSQSAQFALLVGGVFYLLFPVRIKAAWTWLAGFFAVLCLGAPWIAQAMFKALPPLADRHEWLRQSYASHRMEIWDFISRRALERPVLGHGLESARVMHFDTQKLYHASDHVLHPHNAVIQLWLEFGVVGAALASGFFAFLLWSIRDLPPVQARISLAVLMACVAVGVTGYGLWQAWWLGGLFMVAGLSVLAVGKAVCDTNPR